MTTIGIIGLGTMGLGIAQVYAAAGFPVIATDAHAPARDTARSRMAEALQARVNAGKLSEAARDATLANLHIVETLQDFSECDLVIEAIIEKLEAKQALFASLEPGARHCARSPSPRPRAGAALLQPAHRDETG